MDRLYEVRYCTTAALVLVIYDNVIQLDYEIEYVWKRSISGGKLLYLWSRYFALSAMVFDTIIWFDDSSVINPEFLMNFYWWLAISIAIAALTLELILQVQVYALYSRNKVILAIMVLGFVTTTAVTFLLLTIYMRQAIKGSSEYNALISWVPSLVMDCILCFIMVFKIRRFQKREIRSPLLGILVRDSVLYLVTIIIAVVINTFGPSRRFGQAFTPSFMVAVPCVLGSLLLLGMTDRHAREIVALSYGDSEIPSTNKVNGGIAMFSTIVEANTSISWNSAAGETTSYAEVQVT